MRRYGAIFTILFVLVAATAGAATATAGPTGQATSTHSASSTANSLGAASGIYADTAQCTFPFSSTDATGTKVTVNGEPKRVTTLGPSASQTMWDIGGRSQVVGLTSYAAYLDGADSRTVVNGKSGQPNVEKVVGTDPDLVLAPNIISNKSVKKLRSAGLTVYKFDYATSLDSVEQKTLLMGKLTGNCGGAKETVRSMKSNVSHVKQAVKGTDKPRVLYVFGGYAAGKGTFVNEIITTAGGVNVAAQANITGYGKISDEVVAKQNPQWLILNDQDTDGVPKRAAYQSTTAVKKNQTVTLNGNYLSQPAPRIVRPITKLAKALHPDAFGSQSANETTNSSGTSAANTSSTSTTGTSASASNATSASSSNGGGTKQAKNTKKTGTINPGFGVPVALVALVIAAFAALRRD